MRLVEDNQLRCQMGGRSSESTNRACDSCHAPNLVSSLKGIEEFRDEFVALNSELDTLNNALADTIVTAFRC